MSPNPYQAPAHGRTDETGMGEMVPSPYTATQFQTPFRVFAWTWWSFVALYTAGIVVYIIALVSLFSHMQARQGHEPDLSTLAPMFGGMGLMMLGSVSAIVAVVFAMILLYRAWTVVAYLPGAIPAGKAVGFLFIPFYNFYWVFVAYRGVFEYLNRVRTGRHGDEGVGLATACAVLFVVQCVPYLGILAMIPNWVVWFLTNRRLAAMAASASEATRSATTSA